ncbi:transposase, partial [Tepidibacter thalassicus]
SILNNNHSDISDYMKTSIKSIKKYKDYIKNTFECDYTNGLIEGINNKIKVIKRIAFGYKSFFHFKNRILISQNLLKLKAV